MAAYLHPIAALAAIAVAAWQASLGLRARRAGPDASTARARHARTGPWLWAAFVLNWVGGLTTVRFGRQNIEEAATGHLVLGSAIVVLLTAGAILSRHVPTDTRARMIHPLLGGTALMLSALQIFLGLQLLP